MAWVSRDLSSATSSERSAAMAAAGKAEINAKEKENRNDDEEEEENTEETGLFSEVHFMKEYNQNLKKTKYKKNTKMKK